MFDRNGYDDSRYNLDNIAEIAKTSLDRKSVV